MPQVSDATRRGVGAAFLAALFAVSAAVIAEAPADPLFGYAVNSRGNFTQNNEVHALWRIDLQTGEARRVVDGQRVATGFLDLEALAFDAQQRLFGADDESKTLVRVSTVTGLATPVNSSGRSNMGAALGSAPMDFGMAFTCDGRAIVVSDIEQSVFEADVETGRLSRLGAAGALGAPITDIAARGEQLYGIGVGQGAPNLYAISLDPVQATLIGALGPAVQAYNNAGLSFDVNGHLWAITDRRNIGGQDFASQILRIDVETGLATAVAETRVSADDAVVPNQPLVGLESLAITGPALCAGVGLGAASVPNSSEPTGVPIPALSPAMLLLMIALLGILGGRILRRQGVGQGECS